MAEFLTTKTIQSNLEAIIINAKRQILIVSPFIRLSPYFYELFTHASNRGALIRIIYGKNELHPNEIGNIASFKNVELYYYEKLHAKRYLNESKMVITSMNLYEASEKNREMGVLIDRKSDSDLFESALKEIDLILKSPNTEKHQNIQHEKGSKAVVYKKNQSSEHKGYCIRCRKKIKFDINCPYCGDCYESWAQWGNWDYIEERCHSCGRHEASSKEYPQCDECYASN